MVIINKINCLWPTDKIFYWSSCYVEKGAFTKKTEPEEPEELLNNNLVTS